MSDRLTMICDPRPGEPEHEIVLDLPDGCDAVTRGNAQARLIDLCREWTDKGTFKHLLLPIP